MSTLDRNQVDPELIARLLDGRATKAERARVLAAADKSPELLELLADSAAALNEGADEKAQVTELEPRRFSSGKWFGIAAALLVAATIPMWWSSSTIPAIPLRNGVSAAALDAARGGAVISTQRGSAEDRIAQSVVVGARLVDYMALGADTARGTAAVEIAAALRAITGGTVAASRFDVPAPVTPETIDAIEEVVELQSFRAAAWAETARLAALARDDAMMRDAGLRRAFERAASNEALGAEARATAGQIVAALEAMDHAAVRDLTSRFLTELSRR